MGLKKRGIFVLIKPEAGVVPWSNLFEVLFDFSVDVELIDESYKYIPGDSGIVAGQLFQHLIGILVAFSSQYGLKSLGYNAPVFFQILIDGFLVEGDLIQSFLERFQRNQRVSERNAQVPQYGRVAQV